MEGVSAGGVGGVLRGACGLVAASRIRASGSWQNPDRAAVSPSCHLTKSARVTPGATGRGKARGDTTNIFLARHIERHPLSIYRASREDASVTRDPDPSSRSSLRAARRRVPVEPLGGQRRGGLRRGGRRREGRHAARLITFPPAQLQRGQKVDDLQANQRIRLGSGLGIRD